MMEKMLKAQIGGGDNMEVEYHGAQSTNYNMSFKPKTDVWMVAFLVNYSGYQSQFFYHDDTMGSNMKNVITTSGSSSEQTIPISSIFTVASDGTISRGLSRVYTIIIATEGDANVSWS